MKFNSFFIYKVFSVFISFFLISFPVASQNNWNWQNPFPTGNQLNAIHMVNSDIGYCVGNLGTIIKTTNGGQSWTTQSSPSIQKLQGVSFVDPDKGFAVGDNGSIIRTTDGGLNWISQNSGTIASLTGVVFVDQNNGTAVGSGGIIKHTTDGGENWISQSSGVSQNLSAVAFSDLNNGLAVGAAGTILRTVDAGVSWAKITISTTNSLNDVAFATNLKATAVGIHDALLTTTNGGLTWTVTPPGPDDVNYKKVRFSNSTKGFISASILGIVNATFSTTNGGTNWAFKSSSTEIMSTMVFPDGTNGLALGQSGKLLKSTNSGSSWSVVNRGTTVELKGVSFTNLNNGTAVGANVIVRTKDGGKTWMSQTSGISTGLNSVSFRDSLTGFSVGNGGQILKTSNGGSTWIAQNSGVVKDLFSVSFSDHQNGFASGDGILLHTSNGGQSWESSIPNPPDLIFAGISSPDAQHACAIGFSGAFHRTTDGGNTWNSVSLPTGGTVINYKSIWMVSPKIGYAAGDGSILKTTDGGGSWFSVFFSSPLSFNGICFADSVKGYAVGANGLILKTLNGGGTWETESVNTQQTLNGVSFGDPSNTTIAGAFGTILKSGSGIPQVLVSEILGPDTVLKDSSYVYHVEGAPNAFSTWTCDPPGSAILGDGDSARFVFNSCGQKSITVNFPSLGTGTGLVRNKQVFVTSINTMVGPFSNLLPANGASNQDLPLTFSWQPIANATSYDLYIYKATDQEPGVPTISNITQISHTLTNTTFVQFGNSYKWKVVAKRLCNTILSATQTFSMRHLPDLTVSNLVLPASGFSEQPFSVSWQIKNSGLGSTLGQGWSDRIFLSLDTIVDINADILVGSFQNLTSLNPNEVYNQSATITLPVGIANNYFLLVTTDAFSQLIETNDQNNFKRSASPANIQLTPPPDLRVTSVINPNFAFSGSVINVPWTTANLGTGPTTVGNWSDMVYISDSSNFDLSDASLLGTFSHTGVLSTGSAYTNTRGVTLPEGVSGKKYIYVVTDVFGQVYEHSLELNNTGRSDSLNVLLTPPADLIPTQITTVAQASNNQTIQVAWKVLNQGASSTQPKVWDDWIFISKSATFHPDSVRKVATVKRPRTLDPGEEYSNTVDLMVDSNATGSYFFYVVTDGDKKVFEDVFDSNNTLRVISPMVVLSPDPVVKGIQVPASDTCGKQVNIQWYTKNQGPGSLIGNEIRDALYISSNPSSSSGATFLKEIRFPPQTILAGDSVKRQTTVTLPDGISGAFYVYIKTNISGVVFENGKNGNNQSRSSVVNVVLGTFPDLQVSSLVRGPDSVTAGQFIEISFRVENKGVRATKVSSWEDKLYISRKAIFDTSQSTFLQEYSRTRILEKDSGYSVISNVLIPSGLGDSTYFLFLVADSKKKVYEHNQEGNNVRFSTQFFVRKYPPVDLAITQISCPNSANSGNPILISWKATNLGLAPTLETEWRDALYLSPDKVWNKSTDLFVKDFAHSGSLAPGQSAIHQSAFTIPNGLAGKYYLLLVEDFENRNGDINMGNNYKILNDQGDTTSIFITLTPPPDLVVSFLTGPASSPAGQPLTLNFTVSNQGTGPTVDTTWTERFYLSTDLILNEADPLIASFVRHPGLAAGQSYSQSLDLILPISATGNYFLFQKTDAAGKVYEHQNEGNNTAFFTLTATPQLVSDLVVTDVSVPSNALAGNNITVNWKVKNVGANTASGYCQEALYLSSDNVKSDDDILLTSKARTINIPPNGESSFEYSGPLAGGIVNSYHVLVGTDVQNNILESNDDNNITASTGKIDVSVEELIRDSLLQKTVTNKKDYFFRIEVPDSLDGESLVVTLKGDSTHGDNEMYLRLGQIPTRSTFDFSHSIPFGGNQEIQIPELKSGTYYLLVSGNTTTGGNQNITLKAKKLNFDIRSVNAASGGNFGQVTIQLKGSKFGNLEKVLLTKGSQKIEADVLTISDPTSAYAQFFFDSVGLGIYDVKAINDGGDTARLPQGFSVLESNNLGIESTMITPSSTRPRSLITLLVQYSNLGNTDLSNPVLKMTSLAGAPIAFSESELNNGPPQTELVLPLREVNGPSGILRPGASGTISVYSRVTTALGFMLIKD